MSDWKPPHEWCPNVQEVVVDDRPESRGQRGVALFAEAGGPHFADRDFWVDVRWESDVTERHIASHWLYREDGSQ